MKRIVLAMLVGLFLAPRGTAAPPAGKAESFAEATRTLRQGVFLVGYRGGHGTAWVISKKHRLLATSAQVADLFFQTEKLKLPLEAVMNGTAQRYRVVRVFFHPGLRRFPTAEERLSVRRPINADWPINPASPDVAVLELGPDGPDLPVEFPLASPRVLYDLQAVPVGVLGYPAATALAWPAAGERVQASFQEGVVSTATDFARKAAAPERCQLLQYSVPTAGGCGGAPVYVRNGAVVGINNAQRRVDDRLVAQGIRIDSLWELLVHNDLTGKVPIPVAADRLDLKRWAGPDPAWDLYVRVWKLEDQATHLWFDRMRFRDAIDKCDEALTLYNQYARAYQTRAKAYSQWEVRRHDSLSQQERIDLLLKALKDATRCVELVQNSSSLVDKIDALQTRAVVYNNLGRVTEKESFKLQALQDAEALLGLRGLDNHQRAAALSSMAVSLDNLGRAKESLRKHIQAIATDPDEPSLWANRAGYFKGQGQAALAAADEDMERNLRKKNRLLHDTHGKLRKVVSKVEGKLTSDFSLPDGRYYQRIDVSLGAGNFYQIDLKNPAWRQDGDYDPLLQLFDPDGQLVREDDDGGGFPNARIFLTPKTSGKYSLIVTSYQPRQAGPFVLTVERLATEE
jgi:tetratricopeptide (TPR) repeat protein